VILQFQLIDGYNTQVFHPIFQQAFEQFVLSKYYAIPSRLLFRVMIYFKSKKN